MRNKPRKYDRNLYGGDSHGAGTGVIMHPSPVAAAGTIYCCVDVYGAELFTLVPTLERKELCWSGTEMDEPLPEIEVTTVGTWST